MCLWKFLIPQPCLQVLWGISNWQSGTGWVHTREEAKSLLTGQMTVSQCLGTFSGTLECMYWCRHRHMWASTYQKSRYSSAGQGRDAGGEKKYRVFMDNGTMREEKEKIRLLLRSFQLLGSPWRQSWLLLSTEAFLLPCLTNTASSEMPRRMQSCAGCVCRKGSGAWRVILRLSYGFVTESWCCNLTQSYTAIKTDPRNSWVIVQNKK